MAVPSESPRIPQWTLGERMAKSRELAGYTQAQMGAFFEVKAETISTWETQTRQPKQFFDKLRRWADICNVDYNWLVTGGDRLVTYGDIPANSNYPPLEIVDEDQLLLPFEQYPPARTKAGLSLVLGAGAMDGGC